MSALRERLREPDSNRRWLSGTDQRLLRTNDRQLALLHRSKLRTRLSVPFAFNSRRGGVLVAGMLAGAGAFFMWQAFLLDLGTIPSPGPGFVPLLVGAFMIAAATVLAMQSWLSAQGEIIEIGHRDILIAASALLAVPLVFERLGAYLSLGLLAIVMLVSIGRISPLVAFAATVIGLVGCWLFFQVMLGLQLPSGPL